MAQLARQEPDGVGEPRDAIAELYDASAEWMALAEIHFSEAQSKLDDGNLDTAIEQTRFAETRLATARALMIDARELEAMERGS